MIRVSAVIPVWNAESTVAEAVESVLAQAFRDFELIVVNDGSSDGTAAVLESFGNHIKVITRANSGPAAARNAGVRASSGEYLAFLDADDRWMPGMLARTVAALDSDPACAMAYGNLAMLDSDGNSLNASLIGMELAHAPSREEILARMWPIMPSAALIRRSAFKCCGGFREEFKTASYEDAYLWLMLREQGHFQYIPENLAEWRFSLYPRPIKPSAGGRDRATFERLVRERYNITPERLVGARARASRSILGYIGLMALSRGDKAGARRAFARALQADPYRFKNYLRLMKTYLPLSLARSLSGRTARNPGAMSG
jgi:glycosyltransferase involved in cell wall biosynthesis